MPKLDLSSAPTYAAVLKDREKALKEGRTMVIPHIHHEPSVWEKGGIISTKPK